MHVLCPHCHNPIEVVKLTPREEVACPACGSTFRLEGGATTGSENSAGWKVGRFDLIETVGHGGFGTVYKARDPELDRTVAIKILPAHLSSSPELKARFEREARAVSSLNHPHICHLYDVGEQDGAAYLVMEYLEGESLADRLRKGPVPFKQALEFGLQITDALAAAHRR